MVVNKVLIDTNVWLRYFLEDSVSQFPDCKKLIEAIENGRFQPYISNVTIFELAYTLKTFYRLTAAEIKNILSAILKTRNVTIIERTDSKKALALFFKTKIKFADCLIATQVKPGLILVTFDQDFGKLVPGQVKTPSDFGP